MMIDVKSCMRYLKISPIDGPVPTDFAKTLIFYSLEEKIEIIRKELLRLQFL